MWGGERRQQKEKYLCGLRFLIGSQRAEPLVKGQSGQSCIGSTSCHSSPTSCLRQGRSAGQCSGRTTRSDLPPRRGSCPQWQSPHLQGKVTVIQSGLQLFHLCYTINLIAITITEEDPFIDRNGITLNDAAVIVTIGVFQIAYFCTRYLLFFCKCTHTQKHAQNAVYYLHTQNGP